MKLIRHIMSHLLLIGFIFLLVLAYFYRVQLFPADIVTKIDHVAQRVMFWQERPAANQPAEIQATTEDTTPAVDTAMVDKSAPVPPQQVSTESASTPSGETMGQSDMATDTAAQNNETPAEQQIPPAADVASSEPQQTVETPEPQQAITEQSNTNVSSAELLDEARGSYDKGDIAGAIALYQQLSTVDPANPNVFGELGNIFYAQGNWKEAGIAYYEAANRLLDMGNTAQVQYLYRVIQGLDQASADKLKQRLGIN